MVEKSDPMPPVTPAEHLCAACGMCCNGVLFHSVRLQAQDSPRALAALGLKLKRKAGQFTMAQPCTAHKDACCTVYAHRPTRCRDFACRQLLEVANGTRRQEQALEAIQRAQSLVSKVRSLFLAAGDLREHKAFSTRFETICNPPLDPSPEAVAIRDELRKTFQELQDFLHHHFHVPSPDACSSGGQCRR